MDGALAQDPPTFGVHKENLLEDRLTDFCFNHIPRAATIARVKHDTNCSSWNLSRFASNRPTFIFIDKVDRFQFSSLIRKMLACPIGPRVSGVIDATFS